MDELTDPETGEDVRTVADHAPRGVDAFTAMVDVDDQGRVAVS